MKTCIVEIAKERMLDTFEALVSIGFRDNKSASSTIWVSEDTDTVLVQGTMPDGNVRIARDTDGVAHIWVES